MDAHEKMPTPSINEWNVRCYNAKADYWDRMPFADFLPEQILLKHNPKAGMRALDIGSGTGRLAAWLKSQGFSILCLDPSPEMVFRCRAKNLDTLQMTLQEFATNEKFGMIVAVLSLIHVPKKEIKRELARIANWLNPEGTFVLALIEGHGEGLGEQSSAYPRYFSYYTKEEVLKLTQSDFHLVFEKEVRGPVSYLVYIFKKCS